MKKKLLFAFLILNLSACSVFSSQDVRSLGDEWDDAKIINQITGFANKSPFLGTTRINAIAYNGELLLVGQAETKSLKEDVIQKARTIAGVKRVYDQIYVQPVVDLSRLTKDAWITTKVKAAFITEPDFYSSDIKVITENSIVYLLGYVTATQEAQATEIARNIEGVQQVVTFFNQY